MKIINTPRSGNSPLQFTGEKIATATSQHHTGPCQNRWHELAIYRTDSGQYVLSIAYHTQRQGEHDRNHSWACENGAEIRDCLTSYVIMSDMIGYPPGKQFDEKRAYNEKIMRQAWDEAVSDLLAGFPEII